MCWNICVQSYSSLTSGRIRSLEWPTSRSMQTYDWIDTQWESSTKAITLVGVFDYNEIYELTMGLYNVHVSGRVAICKICNTHVFMYTRLIDYQRQDSIRKAVWNLCTKGNCWATIYRDKLYRLWRDTLFPQAENRCSIEEASRQYNVD